MLLKPIDCRQTYTVLHNAVRDMAPIPSQRKSSFSSNGFLPVKGRQKQQGPLNSLPSGRPHDRARRV